MEQGERILFGHEEYKKFQILYTLLYQRMQKSTNLPEQLNEIEEWIKYADAYRAQGSGQAGLWMDEVLDDLAYLKRLIEERIEYLSKKQLGGIVGK